MQAIVTMTVSKGQACSMAPRYRRTARFPYDVIVCSIMGVIGYLMIRFDYPRLSFIIALVLGKTMEQAFHQSMIISDGDLVSYIAGRPTAVVLIFCIVLTLMLPAIRSYRSVRKKTT